MCSHSKKQSILRRLLFTVFVAIAALSNVKAQQYQITQTVQVRPPYTNKLSDYFESPGKIVSVITTTGMSITSDYLYYLYGYIESTDNNGIWIGTNPGITPHPRNMRITPGVGFAPYTLPYSELQQIFSEQTLRYRGITREQVRRDGLPAGTYRICFRLFIKTGWMNQFEQAGESCSAPFRIEEKEPVINQTVQVLPPYTNKLSDYLESPGKIQSVITVTQYPDNQARFNVTGRLEQVDGNIRIRSGQHSTSVRIDGTPSGNGVVFPPYTLTPTNYREMFREPMVYQGITREQVLRDGLPEGNYRICFMLSDARTGKEIGSYCSAPFRIQKKEAIVNQTVNVLPPYTNKLSDYFEAPGKIQSVITVTQYPENQADMDMTATLEQVDGNIRIGSGQHVAPVRIVGTPSGNNVIFPPYTLTHNDYRNVFKEPMVYQGITREQVQRNGLPEGTYRICFRLRKSHSTVVLGSYCSAPFQIRKKDAIVNQAVMVMPPYTNKLSDYFESPGKIRNVITVTQYPDDNALLRVQGTLESADGGIVIGSAQHAISVQIKGTPSGNRTIFAPYTLTYNELRDIFKEPMNYQGITREQVLREGLPEGSYRLCFKLYDAQMTRLLSQACSPPFMITPPVQSALEPPQIILPHDGSELPPEQKQTVQFTWTMPPGAPATTQYTIKIIELNDLHANYRDMLRNSSYPAFFETTVRGVPTYLYTPANPAFQEGKTYAWVVRAVGSDIGIVAAVPAVTFKNDGYSEPAVFTFKKSEPVKVQPPVNPEPPKETPPVVTEEGLKIFVPGCRNCDENFEGLTFDIPQGGSTYYLLGHTLNPNALSGPNAAADPKGRGRKKSNTPQTADLGKTTLAGGARTKIDIPADAIAVSNARNFYLRWEDKSSLLAKRRPKPGEGIVYHLQIREAGSQRVVWEKEVWNRNSYEQTKKGLPFVDGQSYVLHVAALRGVPTPNGFAAVIDVKGQPETLAASCQCEFTYMELEDVPDLVEYTVKGKLSYFFEHDPEKFPLTTTTATLTRYTRLIDPKTGKPSPMYSMMPTPNDDRHSVPVKINDDGTFEATIYAYPDGGLIDKNTRVGPVEFSAYGNLYEFFNLELNSPYYKPLEKKGELPVKTVVDLSARTVDLGEISFNVWSYKLQIEVSKGYSEKKGATEAEGLYRNQDMSGLKGDVKRATEGLEATDNIPYYEGEMHPGTPIDKNTTPVAEGKVSVVTDKDGKKRTLITFDRLICNFQSNDKYLFRILQETEEEGKKKTLYANGFNKEAFRYIPDTKELYEAMNTGRSRFLVQRKAVLIDDTPPRSTVKGKLVFADPCVNINEKKPLANTDVALVLTYLLEDGKGNSTAMSIEELQKDHESNDAITVTKPEYLYLAEMNCRDYLLGSLENRNKVLAVTRTDADGNFEFKDFVRIDSTFTEAYKGSGASSGDVASTAIELDGTLRATVRLVINTRMRHWWLNPSENIDIQPNSSMDVGTLLAYQNTYLLKIKPIGDPNDKTIDYPGGLIRRAVVKVTRDEMYKGEGAGGIVVEEKTIEKEEDCLFSVPKHKANAVLRIKEDGSKSADVEGVNELHIAVSTSDSTGEHSFHPDRILFPKDYSERESMRRYMKTGKTGIITTEQRCMGLSVSPYGDYLFRSVFQKETCESPIVLRAKEPIISGRVLDSENTMRSVEKGEVLLRYSHEYRHEFDPSNPDNRDKKNFSGKGYDGILKRSVSEAQGHGYFQFDNLIPNYEYDDKTAIIDNTKPQKVVGHYVDKHFSSSEYQLSVQAKGYTLVLSQKEKKDSISGNKWFPAVPMKPRMGQQLHFPQILMEPNGRITGYVVDEEGRPKEALVFTKRSSIIKTEMKDLDYKLPFFNGGKSSSAKGRGLLLQSRFSVPAPSGYTDTLFVQPRDQAYFTDTIFIPEMPEGTYDLGKVVVKKRKHRIRIKVGNLSEQDLEELRKKAGKSGGIGSRIMGDLVERMSGIPGITVRIDAQGVEEQVTNDQGVVEFKFENANNGNFSYELIPPDDSEYIASSGELTNHESKEMVPYYYRMRKGATVSGRVTSDDKPVPGAKVWVMNGNDKREVTADEDGRYTLRGIKTVGEPENSPAQAPASSSKSARGKRNASINTGGKKYSAGKYFATIHCGAPEDNEEYANLLGKDAETTFAASDGRATVDFDLDVFYKANIGTLHGFKVTVTDLQEKGGDNYEISGTIQLDNVPGRFGKRKRIDQNPEFKNLKVRANSSEKDAKGRPYFDVSGEAFSIGLKLMSVDLKGTGAEEEAHTYRVRLANAGDEFLKIAKDGLTGGFIRSQAQIEATSFSFPTTTLTFKTEQFYLSEAGDGQPNGQVTSFKSYVSEEKMNAWKTEAEEGREYLLHGADRKPLSFTFVTFDATSPVDQSRLGTDGVIRLKPEVWFINPLFKPFNKIDTLRLNLPEVAVTPGGIEGEVKLDKIDVQFEKWTIEARNCEINASKGGISSNEFVVRTGKIDLRGNDFILNKDMFRLDGFALDKIPLGENISNIEIGSSKIQFGTDSMCGRDLKPHLKLSIVGEPAGSIKGLPGFAHPLVFQAISLLSSGEDILSFAPDCEKMRLYDVVDFLPFTINSYDDAFSLDGAIDYGIPRVPTNINHKLLYTKKRGGRLNLEIKTSDISFTNVGTFKSLKSREDLQKITNGLVELHGIIEEPGALAPIRVVVWKKRTPSGNYRIWMDLEDREKPSQSICLGGQRGSGDAEFLVEKAGMVVDSKENKWDLLSLKLVPAGGYGDNSGFGKEPLYFVLAGDLRTETDIDREKRHIRIKTDDPNKEGDAWRTTTDIDFKKQQIKMVGTDRDPEQEGVPQDGFTDFVFVYDHPNQQLVGDMTITEKKIAGTKFSGALHMVVGRPGFYFMGAGEFSVPVIGKIGGGMIFGYYEQKIPQNVWASILQYSARGEVPCCFTGDSFKGFYAMGSMSIPGVPRIDEEIDLKVASLKFLFEVGAEAAVWGSFQSGDNKIGASAMLYATLEASISVPCVTLGLGAKASIKGYAEMGFNQPYTLRLGVCGELTAAGCIKIGNPLFGCSGSLYSGSKSLTAHVNVEAAINLARPFSSPDLDFDLGWGSCGSGSKTNCEVVKKEVKTPCD